MSGDDRGEWPDPAGVEPAATVGPYRLDLYATPARLHSFAGRVVTRASHATAADYAAGHPVCAHDDDAVAACGWHVQLGLLCASCVGRHVDEHDLVTAATCNGCGVFSVDTRLLIIRVGRWNVLMGACPACITTGGR